MTPILDFENQYSITREGAIYRHGKFKPISSHVNIQNGYLQVDLWKNNKGHRRYVHILLGEHFIPNPKNKPEINHRDSIRTHNELSNLQWVTSSENSLHAYRSGFATQHHKRKLIEQDYKDILIRFLQGESFGKILLDYDISAGKLSTNLKKLLTKWGKVEEYEKEKYRQRVLRARINGGTNAN